MKTISRIFTGLLICLIALSSSCGGDKTVKPDESKVEFNVPSSVTLEDDGSTIDFKVLFNHAPAKTDKIVLEDGSGKKITCDIVYVDSNKFTISLPSGLNPGSYKVYLSQGGKNTLVGTMTIILSDGVTPASGSTVYGQVLCDGKAMAGVIVSDGVEVVKTDSKGVYQLKSKKENKYVFISTPSGYEVAVNGVIPQFFQYLTQKSEIVERVDFTLFPAASQTKHTMLVFGDMHLANRTGDAAQFDEFIKDVNSLVTSRSSKNIYGLTLGDMTWDLYWVSNHYDLTNYLKTVSGIKNLPIYHAIGNHDHSMFYAGDFATVTDFKKTIGPTNYSFNIGEVHYVVLDNILCKNTGEGTSASRVYDCSFADDVVSWFKKDLAFVPSASTIVVTMHSPLFKESGSAKTSNASELSSLLAKFSEAHIFSGHTHIMYNVDKLSSQHLFEHNAGAVCGTWWWTGYKNPGINISQDGTPAGYTVLEVDGKSVKWQYKATGASTKFQFRTYDRNKILLDNATDIWNTGSTANEVYFNVWNYDPSWKIEVTENGNFLQWTKVSGCKDPLHLATYTGTTFPTSATNHIFKVTASAPNTTVTIKVTDRFGNEYVENMSRPKAFNLSDYKTALQ
jgi:Calcineurin-like phosphoesterase.